MALVQFPDTALFYEARGNGEALVLVPGFASGAWSWSWQVDDLSMDFRVVTFDPRGVSNSTPREDASISITAIANDIAALLDELGIDAAHVLGISFGGFVAQEFALAHPHRLKKLVLASTSFGGPNHVAPSMDVLAAFASVEGLNSAGRIRQYLTMAFTAEFAAANADAVDRFCRLRQENEVPREVYMQQMQSAMAFNAEELLPAIAAPTMVITGDADTVVPPRNSRNLAVRLPNARLEIFEGTGHMAFVEKAREFNDTVSAFLKGRGHSAGQT